MKRIALVLATAFSAIGSVQAFDYADFTKAAEKTVNGVVSIRSYVSPRTRYSSYGDGFPYNDPFFEFFFGPQRNQRPKQEQQREPELQQSGLGSGVIIDTEGYIVTNNHVIDGAERLEVTLNDNRSFDAEVVGTDPVTDLALIKISADSLYVIPIGDSEALKVGEWVLAVGNPFGLTSSVTTGIVSAKARNISSLSGAKNRGIESFIQTDAAVNPGNSGGALVTLDGKLVGINAAIYSQTGNYSGSSFAIPVSIVSKVVDDLKAYGNVQRAFLGLSYTELTPKLAKEKGIGVSSGLYVADVTKGSAAQEAGIEVGDVIVAINEHSARTTGEMQELMAMHAPGDRVEITLLRNNAVKRVTATLKNAKGDTAITRQGDVASLGANLVSLSQDELSELGIKSGVKVSEVYDGTFKRAGIRPGFVIIDINNAYVTSADDVEKLYKSITSSDEYDHVMFITGIYPGSSRKVYYAVDLAE